MTIAFIIPAIVFGIMTKSIQSDKDVAKMMSDTMASMGAYVVLAFIGAVRGLLQLDQPGRHHRRSGRGCAQVDRPRGRAPDGVLPVRGLHHELPGGLSIGQVAFMAPIFVPVLMQMGLSPEATQAYRVGD